MSTTCPPSYTAKLEALMADCTKTAEIITVSPAVDAYHRYGQRPNQSPGTDTGVAALEPHISRELLHEIDTKVGEAICHYEAEAFLTGYTAGVAAARGGPMTGRRRELAAAADAELLAAHDVTTRALRASLKTQRNLMEALASGIQFSKGELAQMLEDLRTQESELTRFENRLAQLKALQRVH